MLTISTAEADNAADDLPNIMQVTVEEAGDLKMALWKKKNRVQTSGVEILGRYEC